MEKYAITISRQFASMGRSIAQELSQRMGIQDFAKKDSCIIVGRCGSYCLKDHPRVLKVYIYAPKEVRIRNCVESLKMKEKEAIRTIMEVDSARENYHRFYIPGYVNATLDSDLCINSGSYSIEEAAALIEKAAIQKFGL